MIVEFIGSTGAGKTTLISMIQQELAETSNVSTSFEFIAEKLGLQNINNPTLQNITQELVGFPFFLSSIKQHKEFTSFFVKILAQQGGFNFFTFNNLRSLERKIGTHGIFRQQNNNRILLVDEGTLLLAHNLFVYNSIFFSPETITNFVKLVPLPDVIIYIRAPVDNLISRSLKRSDPPREIKSKNPHLVEKYIRRAVNMFEQLIRSEEIQNRTLIVDNPNSSSDSYTSLVDDICKFIQNRQTYLNHS